MSDTQYDPETLMTESSENRTVIMSENGCVSYEFTTPLVEGYGMATNPYREFRRGVDIKTFTSDTLPLTDATLRANYAIYYENQKLWEAKGNVVIYKFNRKEGFFNDTATTEIYTQQLFWNAKTKQIYSNVDTKVLQSDGWHFGVGFDADESLKNIHFRKYMSEMEFEMEGDAAGSGTRREAHGSDDNKKSDATKRPASKPVAKPAAKPAKEPAESMSSPGTPANTDTRTRLDIGQRSEAAASTAARPERVRMTQPTRQESQPARQ